VTEDGKLFLREGLRESETENSPYVMQEKARQMAEIARCVEMYRAVRPKVSLKGRIVIITDDGLATGATMRSALWSAAQEKPKRLIAAVPVAPEDTVKALAADADELIVVRVPQFFAAVGQFYRQFDQVSDEEVLAMLKQEYVKNRKDAKA
ncbi:MAG: phosphoribosyltransferase family protein, partial [Candidatus Omnitrophota bacterium]